MTTDNFSFYLQNRLIQTSQTGGQWYSDTSLSSIPWLQIAHAALKTIGFLSDHGLKQVVSDCSPRESAF